MSEVDQEVGRREWHEIIARMEALHEESWKIQTVQHERMTEIWLEVARCRARIAALIESGVTFE